MQSIPYCLRAVTKSSIYLAPSPYFARGPSRREIVPTLYKNIKMLSCKRDLVFAHLGSVTYFQYYNIQL